MKLINLIEEDFVNYRKPGMFLGFPYCSGKCNDDAGRIVCQNQALIGSSEIDISPEEILDRFFANPIPQCLIFSGLEPFNSFHDMDHLIYKYSWDERIHNKELYPTVVIYTGFYPHEIHRPLYELSRHVPKISIIVKFGRFIPDRPHHYDPILGVELASDNQFALSKLIGDCTSWYTNL